MSKCHEVEIVNMSFQPAELKIAVGDQVKWIWREDRHSVTSDNRVWLDQGVCNTGATFTTAFTNEGVYPYHCSVHPVMRGVITVGNPKEAAKPAKKE